jgi:hypothetical protein
LPEISDYAPWRQRYFLSKAAHRSNNFVIWNLRKQFWQHGRIANRTAGHRNGTDSQGFGIHSDVHLAPLPTIVSTLLFALPLALAQHLNARAIDQ